MWCNSNLLCRTQPVAKRGGGVGYSPQVQALFLLLLLLLLLLRLPPPPPQASGLLMWDVRRSFGPSTNVVGSLASAQRTKKQTIRSYKAKYIHRSGFEMAPEVSGVEFNRCTALPCTKPISKGGSSSPTLPDDGCPTASTTASALCAFISPAEACTEG